MVEMSRHFQNQKAKEKAPQAYIIPQGISIGMLLIFNEVFRQSILQAVFQVITLPYNFSL